jgi:hypothetical protein
LYNNEEVTDQDSRDKETDMGKVQRKNRSGNSGKEIAVGARFSAPVQTGFEAHPASYIMGTRSLSWG